MWALFSVVATAAQRILSMRLIVSPMMTLNQSDDRRGAAPASRASTR